MKRSGTGMPRLGSEETEAVTAIVCWFAAESTSLPPASPLDSGQCCSRGVKLLADAPLVEVATTAIMTSSCCPGGIKGAMSAFATARLVETVKQFHRSGRTLSRHLCRSRYSARAARYLPIGNMTGFPRR